MNRLSAYRILRRCGLGLRRAAWMAWKRPVTIHKLHLHPNGQ